MSKEEQIAWLGTPRPEFFIQPDGLHCCGSQQDYKSDCGPVVVLRIFATARRDQKTALQLAVFYLN